MSRIVNLRTAKKQRKRSEDRIEAAARAAATGERPAARKLREAEEAQAARRLDQHRVAPPESE